MTSSPAPIPSARKINAMASVPLPTATAAAAPAAETTEAATKAATSAAEATVTASERSDAAVPAAPSTRTPAAKPPAPPRPTNDTQENEENQQRKDDVGAGADIRCPVALRSYALENDVSPLRNPGNDARNAREKPWSIRALAELRRHVLAARFASESVGDELLEVVPDLDPDLTVVDREEHQDAVVAPALTNSMSVVFEHLHGVFANIAVRFERGYRGNDHDIAAGLLQRPYQRLHRLRALRIDDVREVVDRLSQFRGQFLCRGHCRQRQDHENS